MSSVESQKDDRSDLEPMRERRPTVLDRLNNFFGHIFGSHGKRRGARDTDPGS
jgi:hypothetical protein